MRSKRRFARFAASRCGTMLFCAMGSTICVAQFVPIRDLDPAAAFNHDYTLRMVDGTAVGQAVPPGAIDWVPILFAAAGATQLPLPPGTTSGFATGLNRAGTVVGTANGYGPPYKFVGVEWNNGVVTELDALITDGSSWQIFDGRAIDSRGRIACTGQSGNDVRALLFDLGALTDLGALANSDSYATALNEEGVVAGYCAFYGLPQTFHASVFRGGQVIDLHDPGFMTYDYDFAWELNRFGAAVGEYRTSSVSDTHAFWWDGSKSIDLAPALPPGQSHALGINDFGDIVGTCTSASGSETAFLWRSGTVVDLNTLVDPASGWVLSGASAIDNEGRITGGGFLNGVWGAWILEPDCKGTFTIYGTGCAGTGGVEPTLSGTGCPAPDRDFALAVAGGLRNGFGLFFVGSGTGVLTVRPGCDLQVLPLVPPLLPLFLDDLGEAWNAAHLPAGTPIFDLYLQALFVDAGAAHGISGTKPVALHFE